MRASIGPDKKTLSPMDFTFVARVKSRFGEWAVVENMNVVSVAVRRGKAIARCNALNGHKCDDCNHSEDCDAFRVLAERRVASIH